MQDSIEYRYFFCNSDTCFLSFFFLGGREAFLLHDTHFFGMSVWKHRGVVRVLGTRGEQVFDVFLKQLKYIYTYI